MSIDTAISRLAQFRPFDHNGLLGESALVDLVIAALGEADGRLASLGACKDVCATFWGMDVEMDELRGIVDRLVEDGRVDGGALVLSEQTREELDERVRTSRAIEQQAFADWENSLITLYGGLTEADLIDLKDDLELWLRKVMERHGVESALILYPEVPQARELYESIESIGLEFLPARRPQVESIREQSLALFVRNPTEAQRAYLATMMNTASIVTVLTLDPEATRLVQGVTEGQRVYLDTNFIYWVLNLHGPRDFLSARKLLELTSGLGYQIAVTPWTVKELRHSLERARDHLLSHPIPPADLAELAATATTDENFVTAYWRMLRSKPVSPKDFYEYYAEIEDHIAEHGIEIISEGCTAVDNDKRGIDEQLVLIERTLGTRWRPDVVKEHDVKHRLLVQRLRGSGARMFSNAGYWFITQDSLLPRYDHAARRVEDALPFCSSGASWLQTVRWFTPRTDDMDQSLADLLTSPYIRYRGNISYQTVEETVARIDLYKGRTATLGAKVLLNTALLQEIARTEDLEDRAELIDLAVVAAAEDLERQATQASEREATERKRREDAEGRGGQLADELATAESRLEELQEALGEEARRRQQAEDLVKAGAVEDELRSAHTKEKLDEQQQTIDQLAERLQAVEGRRVRSNIVVACLVVLAVIGAVVAAIAADVVGGPQSITLMLVAASGLVCGTLVALFGTGTTRRIVAPIAFIVGFAAGLYELVNSF